MSTPVTANRSARRFVSGAPPPQPSSSTRAPSARRETSLSSHSRRGSPTARSRHSAKVSPITSYASATSCVRASSCREITVARLEGSPRDAPLPARRRRWRPSAAEVRDAPAGARDRDARARARRARRRAGGRRARAADAGVDPSRPLRRAARGAPVGRAARRDAGLARVGTQAALLGRRLLVPDENLPWSTLATPVAIRLARREGIDVVITTSPPPSLHLLGAAVKRASGATWVADLRDPLTLPSAPARLRVAARAAEGEDRRRSRPARRVAGRRDRRRVRRDRRGGARAASRRARS